jgi:hypothetical protein
MSTVLKFGAATLAGVIAGGVGVIAFATNSLVHDMAGRRVTTPPHPIPTGRPHLRLVSG